MNTQIEVCKMEIWEEIRQMSFHCLADSGSSARINALTEKVTATSHQSTVFQQKSRALTDTLGEISNQFISATLAKD